MGHEHHSASGAVSARTAAQERYALRHTAIFDLGPPAIDSPHRTPEGKTLLGGHRDDLVRPLFQSCVVSDQQNESGAHR